MPPVFIFKTMAKDSKQRLVRPSWIKNLPKVVGKWGFDLPCVVNRHFAFRPNGSMDELLFMLTDEFMSLPIQT